MALRDVCLGVLFGIVLGLAMGLSIGLVLDVNDLERWVVNLLSSGKQMATEALSTATSAWDYSELSEYLSGGAVINWTAVEESISSPKLSEAITEAQAAVLEQLSALDEQIDISYYEAQAEEYAQQVIDSMASNLWWVGLLLDGVATLAGTGGKQMLRYAAVSRNAWWYPFGLILTAVVDPAFDLVAYSFAAQSIIAAAAGLVVVWNVLLAPCTLGEQLTFSRKLGAALICTGTVLVGVFGSHEDPQRTPVEYLELFTRAEACYYYLAFAAWGAMCLGVRCCGPPQLGAFLVCAFGGSLAGCSFTTKAAVELTECGALDPGCPGNPFASPLFYLFAGASLVTASLSLLLLAISLRGFEALYMITVYQGFFVLSGALSGNFVMNEKAGRPWTVLAAYTASIGVILLGLYVLCRGELRMLSLTAPHAVATGAAHPPAASLPPLRSPAVAPARIECGAPSQGTNRSDGGVAASRSRARPQEASRQSYQARGVANGGANKGRAMM